MIGTRARDTTPVADAGSSQRRTTSGVALWVVSGAVVVAGVAVYLRAYAFHHMQPVGWDVFGYVWQTSAVGHAPLGAIGARPGVPVLASLLRSVSPLAPMRELVVLPIVLAVSLALGSAGSARTALRSRPWFLPVLIAATLVWPGTARNLAGYDASLLLLAILGAAAGILVQSGGRRAPLILVAVLSAAAALSHAAILAVLGVVFALYVALSIPAFVADRREGASILSTDAGSAAGAVGGGAAAGLAFLVGALGVRPQGTFDTGSIAFLFRSRTAQELHRIRPWAAAPAAAIGAAAAWAGSRVPRPDHGDRSAQALVRLGLAWLVVCGLGVLLSLVGVPVPGARFLLVALPIPVLVGLGLAAVAWLLAGPPDPRRPIVRAARIAVGVALIVGVMAGLARPGDRLIRALATQTSFTVTNQLAAAAAYVRSVPGDPPVVVVVDEPGPAGAYTPKLRLNLVRTAMPVDRITRTVVFVGRPEDLLAGRPTLFEPSSRWHRAYDRASREAWAQVRPALADGAVVLVLERYARAAFDRLVTADPARVVADGVYVLRGPAQPVSAPERTGPFHAADAAASTAWMLVVLGAAGWGFARAALSRDRASNLDVTCLAPAVGAGVAVPVAATIASLGGDPSGPIGVVAIASLAAAGAALAVAGRRRERPTVPGTNG